MSSVTAKQLQQLLGGELVGDPTATVSKPAKIEQGEAGAISFLGNPKYEPYLYTCQSSIILVPLGFEPQKPVSATLLKVKDVYASLSVLLEHFGQQVQQEAAARISEQAYIHPTAQIGKGARIDAFVYIEEGAVIGEQATLYAHAYVGRNAVLGDQVTLHSGVKIYHQCQLGDRVLVHANAVIGSDGFGFAPQEDGSYKKIPQLGNVLIESDVEIGANTVIDRATMDSTRVGQGVKLDNLVQVAHNVSIGAHSVIASQVGIAGSTQLGAYCMVGGQAGFAGHLKIAKGSKIQAQSGLAKSIKEEGTAVWGSPAIDYKRYYRCAIVFKNLPELQQQVQQLQKQIKQLQTKKET
jgi:UDP-3-O-[3-hydroxymyristoyl] glucosamine N-acyltransferase